jgi:hypothetical protein
MVDTTAIALDCRQGRLVRVLLIQPFCNTIHEFGNVITMGILCTSLEL